MIMYNEEFLKRLHADKNKTVYIKITSLSLNDEPRESIEGRCTGGSINVDGASAVRRTCSLTLNALEDDLDITDTYWAFDNKFKLEIGLQNDIDSNYPEVIWFEQGVYVINSFSKSRSTASLSISISGQDKMCRLNGTIGGSIPSEVDFGTEQLIDADGNTHIEKLPIYKIIQSAVRKYGEERLENIIINDLDENGWDLWEYRGEKPMYLIYQLPTQGTYGQVVNMTFNEDTTLKVSDSEDIKVSSADIKYYSMNTLDPDYNTDATKVYYNGQECAIAKIEAEDTAGFHAIPLVYNTDLILKAGETVTSLLDKLKTMLGNFEYYYDLQGRFVFQKKNTYMQELFSPINGEIIEPTMLVSPYSYKFDNLEMITQLSDSPKVDGVKNDFSIWGKRKGATGNDLPIHGRYAIDNQMLKDNPHFVEKKPPDAKFFGLLIINGLNVGVWFSRNGHLYMSEKYEPNTINKFACDYTDHTEDTIFVNARENYCLGVCIKYYKQGLLRFENQNLKNICTRLLNLCII